MEAISEHSEVSVEDLLEGASHEWLEQQSALLHAHSFATPMMRVRALMVLHHLYRCHLRGEQEPLQPVSSVAHSLFQEAKYEEAIEVARKSVFSVATCSFLASAYRLLAFDLLAKQVRTAVEQVPGNGFLFSRELPQQGELALDKNEVLCEQVCLFSLEIKFFHGNVCRLQFGWI